jgi:glycosyltransferase involved in cell wall biosynthesis
MRLSSFFHRAKSSTAQRRADLFDVYHQKTLAAIIDSRGKPLSDWSPADAESPETAARFILGLLRDERGLRRRFPNALSDSKYRDWLMVRAVPDFQLSAAAASNIDRVFLRKLGSVVREFFLHSPEVQWRYPLGLLPVGQKRFVKWLFGKGRGRNEFSDEEILWFLHEAANDLERGITQTYLLNPEWQERFPHFDRDQGKLLARLRHEFPKFRPFRTIRALPPIVDSSEEVNSGIGANVLGHFCYPSGLQQAARSTVAALQSASVRTSCRDVPTGVSTVLESREPWLGLEIHPLTLINIAPLPHFELAYRRSGLARRAGVYRIAYWYWELEQVPAAWSQFASLIDEIWAPTSFVAEAMRKTIPSPVYEMLPGVSMGKVAPISRAQLGIAADDFIFLFMFDMNSQIERKNPLGLIRAFRQAFRRDEKARLVIKTLRGLAGEPGFEQLRSAARENEICLINELSSREEAHGYIAMSDCFVSLHRSEGFGLGLAEAMLLGKPVIATNYSGNLAFMTEENSLLVDHELVSIAEGGPIYGLPGFRWAHPSEPHAAMLMRAVFEDRAGAQARAAHAKAEVAEKLSLANAGARMKARLSAIPRQQSIMR